MELGRLFGIRLVLNFLFLLILLFLWVSGFALHVVVLMWSVLTHEVAHMGAARAFGLPVESVELTPFGGLARIPGIADDPRAEMCVSLAGPFNNFFLIALGLLLDKAGLVDETVLAVFLDFNLGIALFNLVPVLPLDGGRITRALLSRRMGFLKATRNLASLGVTVSILLPVAGVVAMFFGFMCLPCFLLPPFLFRGAKAETERAILAGFPQRIGRKRPLGKGGTASAGAMIASDTSFAFEVVRKFSNGLYNFVIVVNEEGGFEGILTESELVDCLVRYGAGVRLADILTVRKKPRT